MSGAGRVVNFTDKLFYGELLTFCAITFCGEEILMRTAHHPDDAGKHATIVTMSNAEVTAIKSEAAVINTEISGRKPSYPNPFLWVPSSYLAMGLIYVTVGSVANVMFKNMGMDNVNAAFWSSLLVFVRSRLLRRSSLPARCRKRVPQQCKGDNEPESGPCFHSMTPSSGRAR